MKQSLFFIKTEKQAMTDMSIISHKLLYRAGLIRESRAGRYYFLPLGQIVLDKIIKIVEAEMRDVGSQKMFAPILHPIELWQETNRDSAGGYELMTVKDRAGAKFALGGTAEEMFVDLVRGFQFSYKELPLNLYQFGYKFRDELRARGGLLRVREFLMKDAYSFHATPACFELTYNKMLEAYLNIFKKIGLNVDVVPADNGYFGGDYSHEFVVESEIGESKYFISENMSYIAHEDIAKFAYEHVNPEDEIKPLEVVSQPDSINNMEDNQKHYNLPIARFLKNVLFKNRITNELIIVVIRGDLEVNKNKLEKCLSMIGLLEEATDLDLKSLGVKYGAVRSWGHENCTYVADESLNFVKNLYGGQKIDGTDCINVNYPRDFEHQLQFDVALAYEGALSPDQSSVLIMKKGIEVANIFQLGQHYSLKMNARFTDESGSLSHYFMGCYGIGLGRILAAIVEKNHDESGIIWPKSLTPFHVHILPLDDSDAVMANALKLYNKLQERYDVLLDDRNIRPGVKFADSDLIGIPLRVVIGKKSLESKRQELKVRATGEMFDLAENDILSYIKDFYA